MIDSYDVIIVGAGPAGLSMACSLSEMPLKVLVLERSGLSKLSAPAEDGREIALTHLSVQLMRDASVWQRLAEQDIAPIERARVFNGDSKHSMDFERQDNSLEALGYLVPNHCIRRAYYETLQGRDGVELRTDTTVVDVQRSADKSTVTLASGELLSAELVVAADTRFSTLRAKMGLASTARHFSRSAIVCRMSHSEAHEQTAFECFHYGRTLALLPMNGNRSSIVVTVNTRDAQRYMAMSDTAFSAEIQGGLNGSLGEMALLGKRHAYPLVGVHANNFVTEGFALIGDAAVGMHPVTAHGFNLGLRGQATLARCIAGALERGQHIGSLQVLRRYEREHMQITRILYHGTNLVVGLFTQDTLPAKLVRKATLGIANRLPPLKNYIRNALTNKQLKPPLPIGKLPALPSPLQVMRRR